MMDSHRLRLGVIGDPVEHSLSPAMQQAALDAMGIAATYERWHTLPEELPERIHSLTGVDTLGANVTVPYKERVIPMLVGISALARRAGAVNTISNLNGRLFGDNTDVYGLARSLRLHSDRLEGCKSVVLGAGGAARAVVLALEEVGAARIAVVNRSFDRAAQLRDDLAPAPVVAVPSGGPAALAEIGAADVVVNATALGWKDGEMPLTMDEMDAFPGGALVVDLNYRDTDLLDAARARGLAAVDGLEMLVFQGARSLEIWSGRTPPVEIMMQAARTARAARA